tara:strand:- start:2275 stop:2721 length:447 start_codon:yes stop_codon:yes gene_type:complete
MSFNNYINSSPLVALYNATNRTTSGDTGGERVLRIDTSLHNNAKIASNFETSNFKVECFVTADLACLNTGSGSGFGGCLKMFKDNTEIYPRGSLCSMLLGMTSTGATNEIIANTVKSNTTVKLSFLRGAGVSQAQEFQDFTRLIGVVT